MGHRELFDEIVLRTYLPKNKSYKERWNHQKNEIGFPVVNAYSLNEKNYIRFTGAIENYEHNSQQMIYDIIIRLLIEYNFSFSELPINGEKIKAFSLNSETKPLWISETSESAFLKCVTIDFPDSKILFVFRDFGIHNRISDVGLQRLHAIYPFDGYFYVSFVFERAYEEIIDHNDDESDVTRGTQCISLKDFFFKFFDSSEYDLLCEYLDLFKQETVEYMGVTVTRTLQPNAIPGFKKDIVNTIRQKDYYATLCNICQNLTPSRLLVDKISEQFLDKDYYAPLIGSHKFSISFLTAEWLYTSLNKVVTIDQTPIILGYFKSMEQLLFDYVSFQAAPAKANRHKTIKINRDSTPEILNETLMASRGRFMTLGTFSSFLAYIGNQDLIRPDLLSDQSLNAFDFIDAFFRNLADMRNTYLHRENINNWVTVEKARDTAFSLFFILLGAYIFEPCEKSTMGISNNPALDPITSLCEYIHNKALEDHDFFEFPLFYINSDYSHPMWPDPDYNISYDRYGNISYSGIHFHNVGRLDSPSCYRQSFSINELSNLRIEEDVYIINKEDPFKSFIKGDRKTVYHNGIFTPKE